MNKMKLYPLVREGRLLGYLAPNARSQCYRFTARAGRGVNSSECAALGRLRYCLRTELPTRTRTVAIDQKGLIHEHLECQHPHGYRHCLWKGELEHYTDASQ